MLYLLLDLENYHLTAGKKIIHFNAKLGYLQIRFCIITHDRFFLLPT